MQTTCATPCSSTATRKRQSATVNDSIVRNSSPRPSTDRGDAARSQIPSSCCRPAPRDSCGAGTAVTSSSPAAQPSQGTAHRLGHRRVQRPGRRHLAGHHDPGRVVWLRRGQTGRQDEDLTAAVTRFAHPPQAHVSRSTGSRFCSCAQYHPSAPGVTRNILERRRPSLQALAGCLRDNRLICAWPGGLSHADRTRSDSAI